MYFLRTTVFAAAFTVILAACGGGGSTPSVATSPDLAVILPVNALIDNNLEGFIRHTASSEDYAQMQQDWSQIPRDDRAEMDMQLNMLLADGAIDEMMPMVEMVLANTDPEEMAQTLEFMGGMMMAMALGDPQAAQQAQSVITAAAAHVRSAGINDPAKARQAIEHIANGLRSASIRSSADLMDLEFAAALQKLSPVIAAAKEALLLYGIDANAVLGSISATASGETVTVTGSIFDQAFSIPVPVYQEGTIWKVGTVE